MTTKFHLHKTPKIQLHVTLSKGGWVFFLNSLCEGVEMAQQLCWCNYEILGKATNF